jgi:hypothetical protein
MKELQKDNPLDSIRQRLGSYEEAPSEELWGRIAAAQKRERAAVWPALFGVAAVLGIGAMSFFGLEKEQEQVRKEVVVVEKRSVAAIKEQSEITKIKSDQVIQAKTEPTSPITSHQSPLTDQPSAIVQRDSVVSSPVLVKPDSSSSREIVPPYKKPKSKFQLYFAITPSLSFEKIIPAANDAVIVQGLANRSPFSMKRFGFAIDAGLQYDITKILGFYGGISFYRQQQQLTYNYYNKDAQVTRPGDAWTFEIDRPQQSKTFDYTMTNLGAQGGVLITLKGEKLKSKFGAGLNFTQSLNSSSSYLAYQVFYRSEIKINEQFSWFVQPMFNYSFIAKEKPDEPFRLKPYRAGITGGVLYRFK